MSPFVILGICLGGAIVLLVAFIWIVRTANANRFNKKFKKHLQKEEVETEDISFEDPLPLLKEEAPSKGEAIVEEYNPATEEFSQMQHIQNASIEKNDTTKNSSEERFERAMRRFQELSNRNKENAAATATKKVEKDDFEEFMNQHSYGRMLTDKTLYEQIKELSPELKAILFSGLFRPYDEDK